MDWRVLNTILSTRFKTKIMSHDLYNFIFIGNGEVLMQFVRIRYKMKIISHDLQ